MEFEDINLPVEKDMKDNNKRAAGSADSDMARMAV